MMNELKQVLRKLYTLVVDRRLLYYLITLFGVIAGFPELVEQADSINQESADAIVAIVQGGYVLAGTISLLISWAIREPSGTGIKGVSPEEAQALEKLKELGIL